MRSLMRVISLRENLDLFFGFAITTSSCIGLNDLTRTQIESAVTKPLLQGSRDSCNTSHGAAPWVPYTFCPRGGTRQPLESLRR